MTKADEPLSQMEQRTFGADAKRHAGYRMPLEQGVGALPANVQAQQHCYWIERQHGKAAADEMRKKLAAADQITKDEAEIAKLRQIAGPSSAR